MGRPERWVDPDGGPVARFALDLRRLRETAGRPNYRELARRAHYSVSALSEAAGGKAFPSLPVTLAYVEACSGDRALWEARWQAVSAELAIAVAPSATDGSVVPYWGLRTFGPEDAQWFFGHEDLVQELIGQLRKAAFLVLIGPPGSGKSSVLRAGLLPALSRQDRQIVLITPGTHPITELTAGLASAAGESARPVREEPAAEPGDAGRGVRRMAAAKPDEACLVIVDQFEEIFTLCQEESERSYFIECLLHTAGRGARVVLGMRADFHARCREYPQLADALRDQRLLMEPMGEEGLRRIVIGPATRAGLKVEAALVEAIVHDAKGEPGVLPLVSHALLETWKRRCGNTLTLTGYREAGGVNGAIAQTAESIYGAFGTSEQLTAKQILLQSASPSDGPERSQRRLSRADLPADPGTAALLDRLVAASLVTLEQNRVGIAQEALIRHWPRLRGWLTEDRDSSRAHSRRRERPMAAILVAAACLVTLLVLMHGCVAPSS